MHISWVVFHLLKPATTWKKLRTWRSRARSPRPSGPSGLVTINQSENCRELIRYPGTPLPHLVFSKWFAGSLELKELEELEGAGLPRATCPPCVKLYFPSLQPGVNGLAFTEHERGVRGGLSRVDSSRVDASPVVCQNPQRRRRLPGPSQRLAENLCLQVTPRTGRRASLALGTSEFRGDGNEALVVADRDVFGE